MDHNGNPGIIDVAALVMNETDSAVCFVQMPNRLMTRFESLGRDDDGPYLVNDAGVTTRIGTIDHDALDEALSLKNLRLHLIDETGLFVDEYDIAAIPPENANSYGA